MPKRSVTVRVGELGVRGASLMLGYFGDQAATETRSIVKAGS